MWLPHRAVLPPSLRDHVNSGGSISSIPEGKELLNKVLRGAHVGITELVEVGGHNGSNVTYTKVENTVEAARRLKK